MMFSGAAPTLLSPRPAAVAGSAAASLSAWPVTKRGVRLTTYDRLQTSAHQLVVNENRLALWHYCGFLGPRRGAIFMRWASSFLRTRGCELRPSALRAQKTIRKDAFRR